MVPRVLAISAVTRVPTMSEGMADEMFVSRFGRLAVLVFSVFCQF